MLVEARFCNHLSRIVKIPGTAIFYEPNFFLPYFIYGPDYPGDRKNRYILYWAWFTFHIEWGF